MYAPDKAEQELAVENGLSDSRGRPAAIPSVPPLTSSHLASQRAATRARCVCKQPQSQTSLRSSPVRGKGCALGQLTRLRACVPGSALRSTSTSGRVTRPPTRRPGVTRPSHVPGPRGGCQHLGWPEREGTHPAGEAGKLNLGCENPRVPCVRDKCAHAPSNKSLQ